MSGIGKYPFVNIDTERIDFGEFTVGKEVSKQVTLSNYSDVAAEFNIEPVNDDGKDLAIGLSLSHGSIAPG